MSRMTHPKEYYGPMHFVASHDIMTTEALEQIKDPTDHMTNKEIIEEIAWKYNAKGHKEHVMDPYNYMCNYISLFKEYLTPEDTLDIEKLCYTWITVGFPSKLDLQTYKEPKEYFDDYVKGGHKVACITSYNKTMYEQYAFKFMESLNFSFDLFVCHEDDLAPADIRKCVKENLKFVDLREDEELMDFVTRNHDRNEIDKQEHDLKNAVRFSYKVFSITKLAKELKGGYDYIVWLDADLIFSKRLFGYSDLLTFIEGGTMMSYLARNAKFKQYSECGFLIFNMHHKDTLDYMDAMREMYVKDLIYKEKECHDSWIWDCVRKRFEEEKGTENYPIPNDGKYHHSKGNVMMHSDLHKFMLHPKGGFKYDIKKMKRFIKKS